MQPDGQERAKNLLWAAGKLADYAASVGLDADATTLNPGTWAYQLTVILKHGAELAGWLLLATGLAAASTRSVGEVEDHLAKRLVLDLPDGR